VTSRARFDDIA